MGPKDCKGPEHAHVLMCPVQAAQIASLVVLAGMARREEGIGLAWWRLGLRELRLTDAEAAVERLTGRGLGDRTWITVRDVVRTARAIRGERHARAPQPVPPEGLEDDDRLTLEERRVRQDQRQAFIRWYWVAVGNGEPPKRALELAAGTIGHDRYIEAGPQDTGEPVDPAMVARVRGVLEASKKEGRAHG